MRIELRMGTEFQSLTRNLSAMGSRLRDSVSSGLEKAVKHTAARVTSMYLSGQYLNRRSGQLARSVDGWLAGKFDGVIGVKKDSAVEHYKYLLGDENVTIRPKKGKFLSIPIGENLTGTGVARFDSPRDVADGFFVRTNDRLLFGRKNGKRGRFRPLFVMVKEVQVQGTGALIDAVDESLDQMTDIITEQINKDAIDG